eukprot:UN04491
MMEPVIDFIIAHTSKLRSTKPTHQNWTDWTIGFSCFAYLAPALTLFWFNIPLNIRFSAVYEMILYIVVSWNSFLADYVNARVEFLSGICLIDGLPQFVVL